MNTTHQHHIKLPKRTGTMIVSELPDRVVFRLRFSRYGDFGDVDKLRAWLLPILLPYDSDPRPSVFDNPVSGEKATVWGNDSGKGFEPGPQTKA